MNKRLVPFIVGVLSTGLAVSIIIAFDGWWTFLVAIPLLAFGWPSIKTAFQASNEEIAELTGESEISKETAERFRDRP